MICPIVFSPQAIGLEQQEVALRYIQQAKELLHILEAEVGCSMIAKLSPSNFEKLLQTAYLSMLCYNFGLEMFQKGLHQQSVIWLKSV